MPFKLKEIKEFKGILQVLGSGLRIGAGKESAPIGEVDNTIIKHPISRVPYVPGSSIKGKLRSLLESRHSEHTQKTGEPCKCGKEDCLVCQLFGCGDAKKKTSPSRLVFRDCQPNKKTKEEWERAGINSEVKWEVVIDRGKDKAAEAGPRQMERIPAGSDFDFAFSLRLFEGDPLKRYYELLAEGFELLEKDYLGGSGSRGYGQVGIIKEEGKSMAAYLRELAKNAPEPAKSAPEKA